MQKEKIYVTVESIIIVFISLIFLLVLFFSNDIVTQLVAFSLYSAGIIIFLRMNILHPAVLFTICYYFYSISYPLMYVMDMNTRFGCSPWLMRYEGIALVVFLLSVGFSKEDEVSMDTVSYNLKKINVSLWNKIILLTSAITIIAIMLIYRSGYTHKSQIYDNHSPVQYVMSLSYIFIMIFTYVMIAYSKDGIKLNPFLIGIAFLSFSGLGLISGERDIAFTMILVFILMLFYWRKIKKRHLIILGILGFFGMLLSARFKYFFISGMSTGEKLKDMTFQNILYDFFQAEFITASRNLQIIIARSTKGLLGWRTLFSDFIKVFVSKEDTSLTWFNSEIYHHENVGYGFSLVGEGYVISGVVGVVVVFMITGLFMRYLYKKSRKNPIALSLYFNMIPLMIYSIRGNISSFLSPFIKHMLLGWIIILIFNKVRNEREI